MHPWAGSWVPAGADGLASGFGVAGAEEPEGVEVPGGDEEVGLVAAGGGAEDGPDGGADGGPDGGADVPGWRRSAGRQLPGRPR